MNGASVTEAANNGSAAAGASDAPATTDAARPNGDAQEQRAAAAHRSDGEDAVMIDSEGEGQQAEDLFRESSQQNVVRQSVTTLHMHQSSQPVRFQRALHLKRRKGSGQLVHGPYPARVARKTL